MSGEGVKRREENEIEFGRIVAYIAGVFMVSIPLAFVVPRAAAYLRFLLLLDPSRHLVRRATSEAEP